jgi:hypothetical protein
MRGPALFNQDFYSSPPRPNRRRAVVAAWLTAVVPALFRFQTSRRPATLLGLMVVTGLAMS